MNTEPAPREPRDQAACRNSAAHTRRWSLQAIGFFMTQRSTLGAPRIRCLES